MNKRRTLIYCTQGHPSSKKVANPRQVSLGIPPPLTELLQSAVMTKVNMSGCGARSVGQNLQNPIIQHSVTGARYPPRSLGFSLRVISPFSDLFGSNGKENHT